MFGWFDARDAQQFGTTLADFFMERIPNEESAGKNKSLAKKQEVIAKMLNQVAVYKIDHKMNLYKKAKLGNAFKWKLLDANYPADFVNELTKTILLNF
ncbi:MAG: hypothetical protein JO269_09870 [Burkholderiaceae bacterium]|nr:hypothetical protein [Burkholderiaceae bacterium]